MQAIKELEKALGHLRKATEMEPMLQPDQDDFLPHLVLSWAIDDIKRTLRLLKQDKEE